MMAGNPFSFNKADPMGVIYAVVFYTLLATTVVVAWLSQPRSSKVLSSKATSLKWTYLVAWYICVAGDWLQGPYVYALYASFGFSKPQISQLFVMGFGASMVFGTFVGSLADRMGRKSSCQLYCLLYILSCITKHFNSYWILMVGRLTGGIATSLLFSGFESWIVSETNEHLPQDSDSLGHFFAMMWFGNSLIAILSGVIGDSMVSIWKLQPASTGGIIYWGGFLTAFDLAIVLLLFGLAFITVMWGENYGTPQGAGTSFTKQISQGMRAISGDKQIFITMILVACFEGSMYTFVFNWTPALDNRFSTPPFGMIFASFMMAYMCGSGTFDYFRDRGAGSLMLSRTALVLGSTCFLSAGIAFHCPVSRLQMTIVLLGFVCFEFCCGLYFPSISSIKGKVVPERLRSTIYNMYRVPMNAIVLIVLLTNISISTVFLVCWVLLGLASAATWSFEPAQTSSKEASLIIAAERDVRYGTDC